MAQRSSETIGGRHTMVTVRRHTIVTVRRHTMGAVRPLVQSQRPYSLILRIGMFNLANLHSVCY